MLIDSDNKIIERSRYEINRYHLTKMIEELYERSKHENVVGWYGANRGMCYFIVNITFEDHVLEDHTINIGVPWESLGNTSDTVDKVTAAIVDRLVMDLNTKIPPFYIKPVGIIESKL